ncbi:MAG: hypothetical protein GX369_07925 [Euryarchaeota archaeon]|nr:hypothetical protein [Euryarchaeota archaeon]
MAERRVCSFCGEDVEPGTGKIYVKRDGTILIFDSSKCYKNMIGLGRIPRRTRWTKSASALKASLKAAGTKDTRVEIPAVPTRTKATTRRSRRVRTKAEAPVESDENNE